MKWTLSLLLLLSACSGTSNGRERELQAAPHGVPAASRSGGHSLSIRPSSAEQPDGWSSAIMEASEQSVLRIEHFGGNTKTTRIRQRSVTDVMGPSGSAGLTGGGPVRTESTLVRDSEVVLSRGGRTLEVERRSEQVQRETYREAGDSGDRGGKRD